MAGSARVTMSRTAASSTTGPAQNTGFRFDDFYARYRNERGVSCLSVQNSPGQMKTSCTTTTHLEGKHDEVGFLKCQPAEQPASLPTGRGRNMSGEPTRRSRLTTGPHRVLGSGTNGSLRALYPRLRPDCKGLGTASAGESHADSTRVNPTGTGPAAPKSRSGLNSTTR